MSAIPSPKQLPENNDLQQERRDDTWNLFDAILGTAEASERILSASGRVGEDTTDRGGSSAGIAPNQRQRASGLNLDRR